MPAFAQHIGIDYSGAKTPFTASTTLPNSISVPSPMSLTTRPWCSAVLGSISFLRIALRDVSVTAPAILLLNKGGFLKILERGDGEHRR